MATGVHAHSVCYCVCTCLLLGVRLALLYVRFIYFLWKKFAWIYRRSMSYNTSWSINLTCQHSTRHRAHPRMHTHVIIKNWWSENDMQALACFLLSKHCARTHIATGEWQRRIGIWQVDWDVETILPLLEHFHFLACPPPLEIRNSLPPSSAVTTPHSCGRLFLFFF